MDIRDAIALLMFTMVSLAMPALMMCGAGLVFDKPRMVKVGIVVVAIGLGLGLCAVWLMALDTARDVLGRQ